MNQTDAFLMDIYAVKSETSPEEVDTSKLPREEKDLVVTMILPNFGTHLSLSGALELDVMDFRYYVPSDPYEAVEEPLVVSEKLDMLERMGLGQEEIERTLNNLVHKFYTGLQKQLSHLPENEDTEDNEWDLF